MNGKDLMIALKILQGRGLVDTKAEHRFDKQKHAVDSAIRFSPKIDISYGKDIWNLYSELRSTVTVLKPFETRPARSSTKKASGFCVTCAAIATTEALFQLEGAVIIQRYCDACLPRANYEMEKY